jgi:hypothetical protein
MTCEWVTAGRDNIVRSVFEKLDQINTPSNAVFVFDIDHTLIDLAGRPIEPIVYLFHEVKQRGISPVIITARIGTPENIQWTREQLYKLGITGSIFMYFLSPDKNDPWRFKYMARKNVHERGFHVIMTIGDEPWDHGEYGGFGFMVPKCGCGGQWKENAPLISQYF